MGAFFEDAEGFEIGIFVKIVAFEKTVFVEDVADFAGRTKGGDKNSDDTEDNKSKESPPAEETGEDAESDTNNKKTDIPPSVVVVSDVFFALPGDVFDFSYHKLIIAYVVKNVKVWNFGGGWEIRTPAPDHSRLTI